LPERGRQILVAGLESDYPIVDQRPAGTIGLHRKKASAILQGVVCPRTCQDLPSFRREIDEQEFLREGTTHYQPSSMCTPFPGPSWCAEQRSGTIETFQKALRTRFNERFGGGGGGSDGRKAVAALNTARDAEDCNIAEVIPGEKGAADQRRILKTAKEQNDY